MPTKAKTIPSAIESEDTQALAAAHASKQAFADAQALAIDRQAAFDNAEMAAAEMESQFSQGNDQADALAWSIVQADVTRTEMLHNAAQAAEKRAESAVVNTDVTLSLMALPWVQEALKGVEVIASFYVPKTPPTAAVAYIIQRKATEVLGGGSVAGKVEVRYYRPSLYGPLDAGAIQAAAELAHCRVKPLSVSTQETGNGMKVDSAQADIAHGHSIIPLIKDEPTSRQASSNVAHSFASGLANLCRAKTDPLSRAEEGGYTGGAILVKPLGGEVTSTVDDAGVRTTTATLNLNYHRTSDRSVSVDRHLKDVYADWQGSFVPAFGTVTSITGRTGSPDGMLPPSTPVTVSIVFVSRIR